MKKCPACAYGNPGSAVKCCVCGRDLAAVAERPDPQPEKISPQMPAAALALLLCAGLFWLLQTYAWKPGEPQPAADDENYSWESVAEAAEKMAGLRYLPREDKLRALELLSNPDERVALAAVKAAAAWARGEKDPELAGRLAAALLRQAEFGRGPARGQAALETGMLLALGFSPAPSAGELGRISARLAKETDPDLRAAGYFLSSMAGLPDLVPQMRQTLLEDPSSEAKLHAACALSRLGYPEGHESLAAAAAPASALRAEAFACLSYSAFAGAEKLLLAAARSDPDQAVSESAKSALILRKQLAIIKK